MAAVVRTIDFNRYVVEKHGMRPGIREIGMIERALASPWNIGVYSKMDDAAVLARLLCSRV